MFNIFLISSCADLRKNELVENISKLNSLGLSYKDIDDLNYFERCKYSLIGSPFSTPYTQFIWILNVSTLSEKSLDNYVNFLHSVVCGNLPSQGKTHILFGSGISNAYAENKPEDDYNTSKLIRHLRKLHNSQVILKGIVVFYETIPPELLVSLSSKSTCRLLLSLTLKKGTCVIITKKEGIIHCLINGQFETAFDFGFINS